MANKKKRVSKETLRAISEGDFEFLDKMEKMLEVSFEESGLDPETFMLVRIAALAAMDASTASWLINLKVGKDLGIEPDQAIGTLVAIAPVIGTARLMSAAGGIVKALSFAEKMREEKYHRQMAHH